MQKKYLEKVVEKLLMNSLIYGETKYQVIICENGNETTYFTNNLSADIEDNAIWVNDSNICFLLENLENVQVSEKIIKLWLKNDTILEIILLNVIIYR